MLVDYKKSIAYICPYCGKMTLKDITFFDLPNGKSTFYCSDRLCQKEIVTVNHKKDKYVFEVLCTVCNDKHNFTIKPSSLWKKELIVLACPNTTVGIMFTGDKDNVEEELKRQNDLYLEAEKEIAASPELSIYFDLITLINQIAKNGDINCLSCGMGAFDIELDEMGIIVTCRDCGAEKIIEIGPEALEQLITDGEINLE
ncbi:MAG: hypothetical protein Q4B31_05070 [Clostridia bacterium]|nr:hypothetical protein [Clostridia bacterium]